MGWHKILACAPMLRAFILQSAFHVQSWKAFRCLGMIWSKLVPQLSTFPLLFSVSILASSIHSVAQAEICRLPFLSSSSPYLLPITGMPIDSDPEASIKCGHLTFSPLPPPFMGSTWLLNVLLAFPIRHPEGSFTMHVRICHSWMFLAFSGFWACLE